VIRATARRPVRGVTVSMHPARYMWAPLRHLISMDEAAAAIAAVGDVFTAA
jgi:hypothetical protein